MMVINQEAIYELVELEVFALPKSANELPLMKDLFEAIFRVKVLISGKIPSLLFLTNETFRPSL